MGPISNLPIGLLDLFGLRTLGKYPRDVADVIAPVIEIGQLLQAPLLETAAPSVSFTNTTVGLAAGADFVGPTGPLSVPNNESWIITTWKCWQQFSTTTGGISVPIMSPEWLPSNGIINQFYEPLSAEPYQSTAGLGTNFRITHVNSYKPHIVGPGSRLLALNYNHDITIAATDTMIVFMNFQYLRIKL